MKSRPAALQFEGNVAVAPDRAGASPGWPAGRDAPLAVAADAGASPARDLLRLEGIEKSYGEHRALHGISLSVGPGEFLALVGPSGSGKSTLLKIISGFEAGSRGAVIMDGVDVTAVPAAERPTSMVFQKLALWPHMTVAENIAFPLRLRKAGATARNARVEEMMALMHLDPAYRARYPAQLSGGEQQRVALARAMVAEPRLLLLDEPLSALDAKLRKSLQAELRALHRKLGVTFIHVTHDLEEAMVLADRICVMRGGRIVQQGAPSDIYYRPVDSFVASFIGETNLIPVVLADRVGQRCPFQSAVDLRGELSLAADQVAPGVERDALLMVRPEHLRPSAASPGNLSLQVRVTEVFAKGAVIQYQAVARGTKIPIVFEMQGDRAPLAGPGDELGLSFDAHDAFVLKGTAG